MWTSVFPTRYAQLRQGCTFIALEFIQYLAHYVHCFEVLGTQQYVVTYLLCVWPLNDSPFSLAKGSESLWWEWEGKVMLCFPWTRAPQSAELCTLCEAHVSICAAGLCEAGSVGLCLALIMTIHLFAGYKPCGDNACQGVNWLLTWGR